jgi:hypothetical protein
MNTGNAEAQIRTLIENWPRQFEPRISRRSWQITRRIW